MPLNESGPALILARDHGAGGSPLHRRRDLVRVRKGVYVAAAAWAGLAPWERYRTRVEAVAAVWDDPLFCLESAAALLGLPVFGEPSDIHVLVPGGQSRRYGDVVVHTTLDAPEITAAGTARATSTADTAVALGRVLPPAFGLAVADAALRRLVRVGAPALDIAERGREQCERRGRRRLAWIAPRATPAAESPGESVSRAVIEWLGFDTPELQAEFDYEGVRDRVDFYWRRRGVIGESDGYGKYQRDDGHGPMETLVKEKRREDRLRRHQRGFARWDWSDAMAAWPLRDKLAAAGLTPVRPVNRALLETLTSASRSRRRSR